MRSTSGINQLGQVMTNNTTTQIEFERAARTKTFADKHGAALETRLVRFCGQPDASTLPEVHNLLVNAPRGREYSILSSQFAERAEATDLPITVANAPDCYTFLVGTSLPQLPTYGEWTRSGQGANTLCYRLRRP